MELRLDRAGARRTPAECRTVLDRAQVTHPLLSDPVLLEKRARLFKALGDPTRLRILALLSVGGLCLCEIGDALQEAESTLVHHLRMLEEGGLLSVHREGKFTYFRANREVLERHRALLGFDQVNST